MVKLPKKVMLEKEYKDGTSFWRIPCDCGEPNHDARLWFEVDDAGIGSLRISRELGYYECSWYSEDPLRMRIGPWFRRMWRRIKASLSMLFKGYHTMEGDVILDHDGINGLRYAIEHGQEAMIKAEEEFRAKWKAEAEAKAKVRTNA